MEAQSNSTPNPTPTPTLTTPDQADELFRLFIVTSGTHHGRADHNSLALYNQMTGIDTPND